MSPCVTGLWLWLDSKPTVISYLCIAIGHYNRINETSGDSQSKSGYRREVGEARTVLVSDHHNRTIFLSLKFTEYFSRSV